MKSFNTKAFLVDTFLPALLILTLIPSMMLNARHLQQEYAGQSSYANVETTPLRLDGVIKQEPKAVVPTVAKAVISAPREAKVGQLIEVSAENSTGTSFKWVVKGIDPSNVRVLGKSVVFSSPDAVVVDVFVAVALGDTLSVEHTSVVIVGGPGSHPPKPVVQTLLSEIAPLISDVESDDKLKELREIAGAFKQVAGLIRDGAISNTEDIVRITKTLVKKATSTAGKAWEKVITRIEEETEIAADAGNLKTLGDHARHWDMIAAALDPNPPK